MPRFGGFKFGEKKFGSGDAGPASRPIRTRGDGSYPRMDTAIWPAGKVVTLAKDAAGRDALVTAVLAAGGRYLRGADMAITQALKDAMERAIVSYDVRVYLQDTNSNWVDLTDRCHWRGRNQLKGLGSITYAAERHQGQAVQSLSSIELENGDHFWDKPLPATLYATYDSNWTMLASATAAVFHASSGGQESCLFHQKLAVRAEIQTATIPVPTQVTLGIFLVEDLQTGDDGSAVMKLVPLSDPLIEATAEDVKRGRGWYANRSPKFLVEKLLKKVYTESSGDDAGRLPSTWDLEDINEVFAPMDAADGDGYEWVAGHFGRPPEKTLTNSAGTLATVPEWKDEVRVCKAMGLWEWTTGTISITAGSATITGSGTLWRSAASDPSHPAYQIRVGDALIIQSEYVADDGGSALGHEGRYTVLALDTDNQQITLDRPPPGSADEAGVSYSIQRIYCGVGSDLYEYNPATDTYSQLTTSAEQIGSGYEIRRIWHHANHATWPIWGVALSIPSETSMTQSMLVFRFRWNGSSPVVELFGDTALTGVYLGDYIHRESSCSSFDGFPTGVGYFIAVDSSPMVLPYAQNVLDTKSNTFYTMEHSEATNSPFTTLAVWSATTAEGPAATVATEAGVQSALMEHPAVGLSSALRYSMGQRGFLVFEPAYNSTAGAILFAKTTDTPSSGYYVFTYHLVDLGQADPEASALTVTDLSHATLTAYNTYIPMAGEVSGDGSVYVGLSYFAYDAVDARMAILKLSSLSATPTVGTIYSQSTAQADSLLELCYVPASRMVTSAATLFFTYVDANVTDIGVQYGIGYLAADTTGQTSYSSLTTSNHLIQSPAWVQLGVSVGTGTYLIYHVATLGLWYAKCTGTSADATVVASAPAVEGAAFAFTAPVKTANTREFYWISGPLATANNGADQMGKFYMCRWSNAYPTRIELADFTGLSVWDALRHLAEIADARYGFTPDGRFYFKRRPLHQGSDYTFTNVGADRLHGIDKSRGQELIVNYAAKVPSVVRLAPLETTLEIGPDSTYAQRAGVFHSIEASQRDLEPKTIRLVCVRKGRPASSSDANNGKARFIYQVLTKSASTQFATAYTAGDASVYVEDPEEAIVGTVVRAYGTDSNGDEVTALGKVGFKATYSGVDVLTNAAISSVAGEIALKLQTGTLNLAGQMDNEYVPQPGDIIAIGSEGGLNEAEANFEYMSVVKVGDDDLTVSRGYSGIHGACAHSANENVYWIRNGRRLFLADDSGGTPQLSSSLNFSPADRIILDHPDHDTWSTTFTTNPNESTSASSGYMYWEPIDGVFVPVGGEDSLHSTGVSIKLSYLTTDTDGDPVTGTRADEPKFCVGDMIKIVCPGTRLEADPTSQQLAVDAASVHRWKQRESQLPDNPYANPKQALWIARREVRELSEPPFVFHVRTLMVPWLNPLDVVTLQEPDLLPRASEHKMVCYIAQMTFNLQQQGTCDLILRGINAY